MTEHVHISAAEFVVFFLYFVMATILLRVLSTYVHSKGNNGPFSNALAFIA